MLSEREVIFLKSKAFNERNDSDGEADWFYWCGYLHGLEGRSPHTIPGANYRWYDMGFLDAIGDKDAETG